MFLNLPGNVKMPALGYGTWQSTDDSLENALEVALETGYRHIDTAAAYRNEEVIGRVLQRWFESGRLKREDVFVTTKLSAWNMMPDKVEDSIKESLEKLQLDYVDLYLMHFPISIVTDGTDSYGHPDIDYIDVWKKMEEQYDAGRARFIGVSNFSIKKIDRLLKNCRIKPANNQVEMHLYMQQKPLVDFCTENGITVVAYSPLGSRGYNQFLTTMGQPTREIRDVLDNDKVRAIAKKYNKTPAQILLRFLLQAGVSPIPKSVSDERVKENFDVFNFSLNTVDMARLRELEIGPAARIGDWNFGRLPRHPNFEF